MQEVAGATILDYILKNLTCPRISEIIIVTEKHQKVIEAHLANYKRIGKKIQVFSSEKCHSMGDCLREVSELRMLKENFLIIKGSCVLNLNILDILEKFESTLKANGNVIQLKVFTKNSTLHESRLLEDNPYLLLDKDGRILYYESVPAGKFKIEGSLGSQREFPSGLQGDK